MATTRHSFLHVSSASVSSSTTTTTTTTTTSAAAAAATTALQTRIAHKRAELAHLQQLRDLSAQMAEQMRVLEEKLATLSDGTEAVACVLANWDNVMRAIHMAAGGLVAAAAAAGGGSYHQEDGKEGAGGGGEKEPELPVTLVRIPVGINNSENEEKGDAAAAG